MSPPDFTSMDRKALQAFRNMAFYRKEAPTVENNYFTTKSKDAPHPQPADWRPTPIATEWCEHHGPAQHTTGNCKVIADPENKGEQKKKAPKPKIDPKAFARWRIQYHEKLKQELIMLKRVERMKKTASEDGPASKKRAAPEDRSDRTIRKAGPASKKRKN